MTGPLTEREALIVRHIGAGFTRWKIAELTGLSETTVRATIRDLCERYGCRMERLPAAVANGTPEGGDHE